MSLDKILSSNRIKKSLSSALLATTLSLFGCPQTLPENISDYEPPVNVSPPQNNEGDNENEIKTADIGASEDSYVSSSQPSQNFGDEWILYTGNSNLGSSGYTDYIAFIKFDVSRITAREIIHAELSLVPGSNASYIKPLGTTEVGYIRFSSWGENSISYDNMPTQIINLDAQTIKFDVAATHRFDVTGAVRKWYNYTIPNNGLAIKTTSFSNVDFDYAVFYSKENGFIGPRLEVTYRE
ncbi:DNRLRE domain-containing protein [Candidatus Pacearchaeota archaeon]|nr:DNRLRE domain-containing protein [Candidatus Pacearchaeota archaeon]